MKHPVSNTDNNMVVHVDLINSPAAKRIAQQPQLLSFAKEILQKQSLTLSDITLEYDMGRQIGFSPIVSTTEKDTVFYAREVKDSLYSRFIKITKPQPTQVMTLWLRRSGEDSYELYDLALGQSYPPRPGSDNATKDSMAYWLHNAFMFDNQSLQSNTITKTCPY